MASSTVSMDSDDSQSSIVEVEVPARTPPPIIDLLDDETDTNAQGETPNAPPNPEVPSVIRRSNETGVIVENVRIKQERVEEDEVDGNDGIEEIVTYSAGVIRNCNWTLEVKREKVREAISNQRRRLREARRRERRNRPQVEPWRHEYREYEDEEDNSPTGIAFHNMFGLGPAEIFTQPLHSHAPYSLSPFAQYLYPVLPFQKMKEEEEEEDLTSYPPDHWTPEMIKFYDEPWGNEKHFKVEKLQAKMDKDPILWEMSGKDIAFWKGKKKEASVQCLNCFSYDHDAYACPDEPKPTVCHMCGQTGHIAHNCPRSICLNCGTPTSYYVSKCKYCKFGLDKLCERCNLIGHIYPECTDHWRLYHSTTGTIKVKQPTVDIYKPLRKRWCCNCGGRGHLQIDCGRCVKNSDFSDSHPFVKSYIKAFSGSNQNTYRYEDPSSKRLQVNIMDNIITNPNQGHDYRGKLSQLRNRMRILSMERRNSSKRQTWARSQLGRRRHYVAGP